MLDLLFPPRCVVCTAPGSALCSECAAALPPALELAAPPGFEQFASLLSYEGTGREVVAALKFNGHLDAVALLAGAMAELVTTDVDVVTWAPTSARRRRRRGYDQARLLAVQVARALGVRTRPLLHRRDGLAQTGLDRQARLGRAGFDVRGRPPRAVLVVDDVRTTGATMGAAAEALLGAGVRTVAGVTLASTP